MSYLVIMICIFSFFRQAFYIARKNGIVTYITPHTYLQYTQLQKLRTWLYQKTHLIEVTLELSICLKFAVVDNCISLLQNNPVGKEAITLFSNKEISSRGSGKQTRERSLHKVDFSDQAFNWETIQNSRKLKDIQSTLKNSEILFHPKGLMFKQTQKKIDYLEQKDLQASH